MEIDKKVIVKLIQILEDLKKSLKGIDLQPNDNTVEELKSYYGANLVSDVNVTTIGDRKKYKNNVLEDFNFMRKFDKVLFSNSTFPWWASVLSNPSEVWFNNEWQPNHYNGMIKLGETNYKNWNGINPISLKEK